MKCFVSMLRREFRIARKSDSSRLLLTFCMTVFIWFALISIKSSNSLTIEDNAAAISMLPSFYSMLTIFYMHLTNLQGNNHKADINSRFLVFSYTLPVTPVVRTAAVFTYRLIFIMFGYIISIINGVLTAGFFDRPFDRSVSIYPLLTSVIISIINFPADFFIFRARNEIELKKYTTQGNAGTIAVTILAMVIFLKAKSISIMDLLDSEKDTSVSLPKFDTGDLAWAIPLFLLTEAICFLLLHHSLKESAPSKAAVRKNTDKKEYTIEDSNLLNGFLCQSLTGNKAFPLIALLLPLLCVLLPFMSCAPDLFTGKKSLEDVFRLAGTPITLIVIYLLGFLAINILISAMFSGDTKKLFAYFVATTPEGISGYVKAKYLACFMINLLYHISWYFTYQLFATVSYFVTGSELPDLSHIYLLGVFFVLLIGAFDFPLIFRFGLKNSSTMKMTGFFALAILAMIIFSLFPEHTQEKIVINIIDTMHGKLSQNQTLIISLIPYPAVALYFLSMKLSEKLYLSGAEKYE